MVSARLLFHGGLQPMQLKVNTASDGLNSNVITSDVTQRIQKASTTRVPGPWQKQSTSFVIF